jgi:hypothetical protein
VERPAEPADPAEQIDPTTGAEPGQDGTEDDVDEGGARARFERSRTGQTLITYVLLVFLVGLGVQNLPKSVVRRDLKTVEDAFHDVGYDQDWSVFAPDPRAENIRVRATLTYPDGSTAVWKVPKGNVLSAYRDYRWQKFQERLRVNDYTNLWRPTCQWLVETKTRDGRHAVKVVLTREAQPVVPIDQPGTPQPKTWTVQDYYTYRPGKP